eukprot:TRINITY_DN13773_c0_g1_i1.p1 TRINITY_DN13773_c0_g1~~TRINITY_DN13773_c0_g1_i1.p1  ORF type:complete len:452 (-),score=21.74 TRINITY_DN13773_c0_g1_i1:258-1613(-)
MCIRDRYMGIEWLLLETTDRNDDKGWKVQYDSRQNDMYKRIWFGELFKHESAIVLGKKGKKKSEDTIKADTKLRDMSQQAEEKWDHVKLSRLALGNTTSNVKSLINCIMTPTHLAKIAAELNFLELNPGKKKYVKRSLTLGDDQTDLKYPEAGETLMRIGFENHTFRHRCFKISFKDTTALKESVLLQEVVYKVYLPCSPMCKTCKTSHVCTSCERNLPSKSGFCGCIPNMLPRHVDSPLFCDPIEDSCRKGNKNLASKSDLNDENRFLQAYSNNTKWEVFRGDISGHTKIMISGLEMMQCHFLNWLGGPDLFTENTLVIRRFNITEPHFYVIVYVRIVLADYNPKNITDKNTFCIAVDNSTCDPYKVPFWRPLAARFVQCGIAEPGKHRQMPVNALSADEREKDKRRKKKSDDKDDDKKEGKDDRRMDVKDATPKNDKKPGLTTDLNKKT